MSTVKKVVRSIPTRRAGRSADGTRAFLLEEERPTGRTYLKARRFIPTQSAGRSRRKPVKTKRNVSKVTKISAMTARRRFGEIMNRVSLRGDTYIVERAGRPLVRLSPPSAMVLIRMTHLITRSRHLPSGVIRPMIYTIRW